MLINPTAPPTNFISDESIATPLQSWPPSHPSPGTLLRYALYAGQVLEHQALEHHKQWLRAGPGTIHKQFKLLSNGGL